MLIHWFWYTGCRDAIDATDLACSLASIPPNSHPCLSTNLPPLSSSSRILYMGEEWGLVSPQDSEDAGKDGKTWPRAEVWAMSQSKLASSSFIQGHHFLWTLSTPCASSPHLYSFVKTLLLKGPCHPPWHLYPSVSQLSMDNLLLCFTEAVDTQLTGFHPTPSPSIDLGVNYLGALALWPSDFPIQPVFPTTACWALDHLFCVPALCRKLFLHPSIITQKV